MGIEFLSLVRHGLVVLHHEPVIAARHAVPVVGPVPSGSRWADLLQELAVAVKYINFCRTANPGDVPRVVVAVTVRRKVQRVVDYEYRFGGRAATVPVPGRHLVLAR